MKIIDNLMVWIPIIMFAIALLLACALRIVRRGAASSPSLSAVADDPFFYPFGEMPTVPRERLMVARDFRAWGIPLRTAPSAAVAHRRNESGGRPASLSGTAVVLTFPGPLTPRDLELIKARRFQKEQIASVFGGDPKRNA